MNRSSLLRRRLPRSAIVAVLAFVLATPHLGYLRATEAVATAAATTQQAADRAQRLEMLRRVLKIAEKLERESPRDSFDPQGVIDQVGTSPEKLFQWTRDQTS